MTSVMLAAEDAKALADANRAEMKAKQAAELVVTRAKLALLDAADKKLTLIDTLAERYGFDPDKPFAFEASTGEVKQ